MPEQPITVADHSAYRKLAYAVLIQAIRDATAERRARKQKVSRSAIQDRVEVKRDAGKADYFLLNDKEVFEFWCELAGLDPRTVRNCLHRRLRRREVFMMIRGHEREREQEPAA